VLPKLLLPLSTVAIVVEAIAVAVEAGPAEAAAAEAAASTSTPSRHSESPSHWCYFYLLQTVATDLNTANRRYAQLSPL